MYHTVEKCAVAREICIPDLFFRLRLCALNQKMDGLKDAFRYQFKNLALLLNMVTSVLMALNIYAESTLKKQII